MLVADLGEFELIERLAAVLGPAGDPGLLLGIGDDAAVWSPTPNTHTVATTDALVEGVHFDLATTSWTDLGWKAMAENVSDIAAMGCRPRYALIALALPPHRAVAEVEDLYRGIAACAADYGFSVVGGDVARAAVVVLQVTLVGESLPSGPGRPDIPLLVRSGAEAGDMVAVTGPLGASAAGLRLALGPGPYAIGAARAPGPGGQGASGQSSARVAPSPGSDAANLEAARAELLRAHLRPIPRVAAGLALVEAGVRCAIDVSDGLVADLGHICERSGLTSDLDAARVPIAPAASLLFGPEALDLALGGGEDYELICTAPPAVMARASALLVERGESPLTVIGSMAAGTDAPPRVRVHGSDGTLRPVASRGYQHFGPRT